jgi:hypothetical protein
MVFTEDGGTESLDLARANGHRIKSAPSVAEDGMVVHRHNGGAFEQTENQLDLWLWEGIAGKGI